VQTNVTIWAHLFLVGQHWPLILLSWLSVWETEKEKWKIVCLFKIMYISMYSHAGGIRPSYSPRSKNIEEWKQELFWYISQIFNTCKNSHVTRSLFAYGNYNLHVVIILVRIQITLIRVRNTLVPDEVTLCVWKLRSCVNHTLRVEITLLRKSHSACINHTLRVVIALVHIKITLIRVKITLVRDNITLCVWKLHYACGNYTMRVEITLRV
jgi:hypothetical protein